MSYKIGICDDQEADIQYIASLVSVWAKDRGVQI